MLPRTSAYAWLRDSAVPLSIQHSFGGLWNRPKGWSSTRVHLVCQEMPAQRCRRAAGPHCWRRQPQNRALCIHRIGQEDACVALASAQQLRLSPRQVDYCGPFCHLRHELAAVSDAAGTVLGVQETVASPAACALPEQGASGRVCMAKRTVQTTCMMSCTQAPSEPCRPCQPLRSPRAPHATTGTGEAAAP